jgi:hypothetical protein
MINEINNNNDETNTTILVDIEGYSSTDLLPICLKDNKLIKSQEQIGNEPQDDLMSSYVGDCELLDEDSCLIEKSESENEKVEEESELPLKVQTFGSLAPSLAGKREAHVWLRFIIDLMIFFAIIYTI